MLRQFEAQNLCDIELRRNQLWDKGWRTSFSKSLSKMGVCNHNERRIILSTAHLETCSDAEVMDTIKHEVAHALTPNDKFHGPDWVQMAIKLGCTPKACAYMNVDASALSIVETVERGIIKAVQNFCPRCYETAVEVSSININGKHWIKFICYTNHS